MRRFPISLTVALLFVTCSFLAEGAIQNYFYGYQPPTFGIKSVSDDPLASQNMNFAVVVPTVQFVNYSSGSLGFFSSFSTPADTYTSTPASTFSTPSYSPSYSASNYSYSPQSYNSSSTPSPSFDSSSGSIFSMSSGMGFVMTSHYLNYGSLSGNLTPLADDYVAVTPTAPSIVAQSAPVIPSYLASTVSASSVRTFVTPLDTIPEPASVLLFLAGFGALLTIRYRVRSRSA